MGEISLNDKYDLTTACIYVTGTQALVRLCLEQAARDAAAGLNTGGYVSGYRGSPLGGVDYQFTFAKSQLEKAGVIFEPGLNEDLAATAIWGTQQVAMRGEGARDGVFALWYGKGPGVDRSGDVFRHANLAGTAPHGGVLVAMGDDHSAESSTTAHQSDYALVDAQMPILYPADVADILSFGLHGWAMSRFSSLWVGIKTVKDNVESSGTIVADHSKLETRLPDFEMPEGGLNIRVGDTFLDQEERLHRYKLDAARAYARENKLDQVAIGDPDTAKIGIISAGKSHLDVMQALEELKIDETVAQEIGLAVYKVAMVWPLEPEGIRDFAKGLDRIIVVEEKRGLMEDQIRSILYGQDHPPIIEGKRNSNDGPMFQAHFVLTPLQIAHEIGTRLTTRTRETTAAMQVIAARLEHSQEALPVARGVVFCAGCPHNSSTVVPDGARSFSGIGCHFMAQLMDRGVEGYTHMGAEGANWIGERHFSTRDHVFQNLGDGTYNHSGIQAIRAAVGSGATMTYKILYNDAVAMTGGQRHDGGLDPYTMVDELRGMGIKRIDYVTDDPGRIDAKRLPSDVTVYHRKELMRVQEALAKEPGVTVLFYDQTCASEKRRRTKRGTMEAVDKRSFINPEVCEGCGDCSVQSNCVAIQPVDTALGRKRKVDQSSCNKDFTCQDGFCPSFVTLDGAVPKREEVHTGDLGALPAPEQVAQLDKAYAILVTGVGGTGVVTVGALIGMAAHIEGKAAGLIDMAGLAQKGGSVYSHIKLAARQEDIKSIRVASGTADLLLGCDVVVSASTPALSTLNDVNSHAVLNTHETMTGDFARDRDFTLPTDLMHHRVAGAVATGHLTTVNATEFATRLLGDAIGANLFMLGVAYQKGLLPLDAASIEQAITLNNVAVELNRRAFRLGRHWVLRPEAVMALLPTRAALPDSLDEIIADRVSRLNKYQNAALAERYAKTMTRVSERLPQVAASVARNYYKLLAYKDEYEVARLFSDGAFEAALSRNFDGIRKITFHMAPPILGGTDPKTGNPKKRAFGPWMLRVLKILSKGKILRGTPFDPFGYTQERRRERRLIAAYEVFLDTAMEADAINEEALEALADLPDQIRGYGPVKMAAMDTAEQARADLMERLLSPQTDEAIAAQ